jgi:hypothetical protein
MMGKKQMSGHRDKESADEMLDFDLNSADLSQMKGLTQIGNPDGLPATLAIRYNFTI